MGIREMQGTPAELEYIGPHGRKRKKNCIYNRENICKNPHIQNYLGSCVGRMYCGSYKVDQDNDLNKIQVSNSYQGHKIKKSKINLKQQKLEERLLNKSVRLLDLSSNEKFSITIVSEDKKDAVKSKISIKSPLGQALCNEKLHIGSVFEVDTRNSKSMYKIIFI